MPATRLLPPVWRGLVLWVMGCALAGPLAAAVEPRVAQRCDRAARVAAERHGVPLDVMMAITRVETGRSKGGELMPWPWTVNHDGEGHWFASRDAAQAFVFRIFKGGARSFDVGCFQINYRWHSEGFRSIDAMFDPDANADYAARFLARLHGELGSWSAAAGAYHSRTESYARIYRAKFDRVRADVGTSRPAPARSAPAPLTVAREPVADAPRLGSLVPVSGAVTPFIRF
ncbi:transglycosylase SLT domain-containing protein [Lutimaribacter marinistellae]|uniref:Transglycosylase SLT domain-containing protein n=1 Tax=Lutimaribacter marinistellae TaxID=1820329 RepID=A0ABV7TBX1_9RHOB